MKRLPLMLTLALLCASGAARADESDFAASFSEARAESPRRWTLELNGTRFTPDIDAESNLSSAPYATVFGKKKMWLFEGELDFQFADALGPIGVGLASGFGWISGSGIFPETGEASPDPTALKVVPIQLMLVYRFQWFDRAGVPLIPFVKAGLAYTLWWSLDGSGEVARVGDAKALGGKWGYTLAGGLAFSLNFIDRQAARELDAQWGINDVLLLAQFVRTTADNFGGDGIDLTRDSVHVGLAFEF